MDETLRMHYRELKRSMVNRFQRCLINQNFWDNANSEQEIFMRLSNRKCIEFQSILLHELNKEIPDTEKMDEAIKVFVKCVYTLEAMVLNKEIPHKQNMDESIKALVECIDTLEALLKNNLKG